VAFAGDLDGTASTWFAVGAAGPAADAGSGRVVTYASVRGPRAVSKVRQMRTDGATPIAPSGISNSRDAFQLEATVRSAAGRESVFLEWEIDRAGSASDGPGLNRGTAYDTGPPDSLGGPAARVLGTATVLENGAGYSWRLRVGRSDPFFSPRTGWIRLPSRVFAEPDVRVGLIPAAPDTLPIRIRLSQNHPNPFNPETRIVYWVSKAAFVHVEVFDVLGKRVRTLVETHRGEGRYETVWSGEDDSGRAVASGVYFVRVEAEGRSVSRKMVLVR